VARHNADTGLNAVLFEIEVTQSTKVFDFHEDNCLLFPVGSTFHISSIDRALDGVWYVKLIYTIEQDLPVIIEQLQYEVDQPLNWLTFGHFLRALELEDEAKGYYNFWLRTLVVPDKFSIHHHLGMLHAEIGEDLTALDHMNEVLGSDQPINNEVKHYDQQFVETEARNILSSVDLSTLFGNIADIHYIQNEHDKALDFYEKALRETTDQQCRRDFQYKHNVLKKMLRPIFSPANQGKYNK
jgi:tetratricopeptide (TPR) repeat protein